MNFSDPFFIKEFLIEYPKMSLSASQTSDIVLEGLFEFTGIFVLMSSITDSYNLKIIIPNNFPITPIKVSELASKIPKISDFHINPDQTFCLGSPLRVLQGSEKCPSLSKFVEIFLVPYLYAVSRKLESNEDFVFGELQHGDLGVIEDYKKILQLSSGQQIITALELLGLKKRIANKRKCPCGCRKKLGACRYRHLILKYRKIAPRSWYRREYESLRNFEI